MKKMGNKKGRLFLTISFVCLLVSGWFYFGSPPSEKNPQIEVLTAAGENKWQQERLKAGIEQAAKELGVEIIYTEAARKDYRHQQAEIMAKTGDFYKAVMYGGPSDRKKVENAKEMVDLEMTDFRDKIDQKKKTSSTDYQRGAVLGKYLVEHHPAMSQVIYWQAEKCTDPKARVAGLENQLASDQLISCVSGKVENLLHRLNDYSGWENVLLVMDTPEQLTDYLESSKRSANTVNRHSYLLEFSDKVLAAIDDGDISAAVFQDDYSRGYQSIYQLIGSSQPINRQVSNNRIIDKQNLFSKKMEPLLFPYNE